MTFDLSSLPDDLQPVIKSAIESRNKAIALTTNSTKQMIRALLLEIADSLGTGTFSQTDELTARIEAAKKTFAANLDEIIGMGTLEVISTAMGIGASVLVNHLDKSGLPSAQVKPIFLERAKVFARTYAQDTVRSYAPGTGWKLSERIWNLAGDNLEQIQKILRAGEGTDAVKLAKALRVYIKEGRETFAEQYPNMMERMGGRIAKNTSYEALRLTRNELSEVYWQGSIEGYKNNDAIEGVKMLLSNSHPKPDVCDRMTQEDQYGLGPGCYPIGMAPNLPHVCCLCCLAPFVKQIEGKNETK